MFLQPKRDWKDQNIQLTNSVLTAWRQKGAKHLSSINKRHFNDLTKTETQFEQIFQLHDEARNGWNIVANDSQMTYVQFYENQNVKR